MSDRPQFEPGTSPEDAKEAERAIFIVETFLGGFEKLDIVAIDGEWRVRVELPSRP